MSRYIDADALKEQVDAIWDNRAISLLGCRILTMIDNAPHIDIVRCKECKWDKAQMIPKEVKCIYQHNPDDFCSYGEREGE